MYRFVLLIVCLTLIDSAFGSNLDINEEQFINYASKELKQYCDSISNSIKENKNPIGPDGRKLDLIPVFDANRLKLKDKRCFRIKDRSLLIVIIGCAGKGEILVFDSTNTFSLLSHKEINYPDLYVTMGRLIDVDGDGNNDIPLYYSSGSHGMYISIVRIDDITPVFLKTSSGHETIFSPFGNISLKELRKDGITDIIVEEYTPEGDLKEVVHSFDIIKKKGD